MNANLRRPIPTLAVLSLGLLACGDDEVPIGTPGAGTPDAGGVDVAGGGDSGGTDTGTVGAGSVTEAEVRALAADWCEKLLECGFVGMNQEECASYWGDYLVNDFNTYARPEGEACERAYLEYLKCSVENGYCYTQNGNDYFEAYSEDCYGSAAEACGWDTDEYEEN